MEQGRAESRAERGQASVELVAALPALILAAAIALQLLLVGYSLTIADGAAEAGALAGAGGRDARRAARGALPGWARGRSQVSAEGGLVRVEVSPPAPVAALGDALTVSSEAWSRPPRGPRQ
ncbi:MAG: pilus assembly protein [Solirubrobacterales bacterium]